MIQGRNLKIYIGTTAIAAAKNCELQLSQAFITSCSPTSGRAKNNIPASYSWSISTNGLVGADSNTANMLSMLIEGTPVTVRFRDPDMWVDYSGTAYVKSIDVSGQVGSITTYSLSLIGSGELATTAFSTITLTPEITLTNININCDGTTPVIEAHEGDNTYLMDFTTTKASILVIETTSANACMFLHKYPARDLQEALIYCRTAAFLDPNTTGYMAHVHGASGYYEARIAAGTYTITWDASPTGTVKIKD